MNDCAHLPSAISKLLSANDTGETGSHQAGILVPKRGDVLSFFPRLDGTEKNPRVNLMFLDDYGQSWNFVFIYYNNIQFGGTRNEYRLTGMTAFIRSNNLKAGDTVKLFKRNDSVFGISFQRQENIGLRKDGVLRLGGGWKVISF